MLSKSNSPVRRSQIVSSKSIKLPTKTAFRDDVSPELRRDKRKVRVNFKETTKNVSRNQKAVNFKLE